MKSRLLNQKRGTQPTILVAGLCAITLTWACFGAAANEKAKDPETPFDSSTIVVADDPTQSGATGNAVPQQKKAIALTGSPEIRAEALLKEMTLDEKAAYVGGLQNRIQSIPRLGLPEIMMSDGPLGLRKGGMRSTCYPVGPCAAATWNTGLMKTMGEAFGRDFRARGFHIALGPGVNIIRDPRGGRNFEYYSEDPFLTGEIASAEIQAMQSQGTLACVKHYACNEQEKARNFYSAEVEERALHEIYLEPFRIAIQKGKAGTMMTAFNKFQGVNCSENPTLNTDLLRNELGFTGILMSDWTAVRDGLGAANGGMDLEMPFGKYMSPEFLKQAIAEGKVSEQTIDEKVRRILRTVIAAGFLDREQKLADLPEGIVGVKDDPRSVEAALEVAREGVVLLKNQNGMLPLDPAKVKTVAVIGDNALKAYLGGGGSSMVGTYRRVSLLDGIKAAFPGCKPLPMNVTAQQVQNGLGYAGPVKLELFKNGNLQGAPAIVKDTDQICLLSGSNSPEPGFPATYSARWTTSLKVPNDGYFNFVSSSNDGIRVFVDDQPVILDWSIHRREFQNMGLLKLEAGSVHQLRVEYFYGGSGGAALRFAWKPDEDFTRALETARSADVALVGVGFNYNLEGEGQDRDFALPPFQQTVLKAIAEANPRTVVVLFGGGAIDCHEWIDKVPALLHAFYPGQEGGTAITEILTGVVNPSGKLPFTVPRKIEDHPSYPYFLNKEDMAKNRAQYGEGIFVGYRGYDAKKIEPLFAFGHGLSYTSFKYNDLQINGTANGKVTATFTVTNTGTRDGSEVAQLYVAPGKASVPRPPQELKGFAKVKLKPGETKTIAIELEKQAFAYWSPEKKAWLVEPGNYGIHIGASSRDIRLQGACKM